MNLKALYPSATLKFTLRHKKGLTKTLLIMKLTAIILLTVSLAASARGHSQTVTLKEKNAQMQTVFEKIQKQTGYIFWYEDQLIQKTKPVDITIQNASLDQALQLLFKDQPLSYEIVGKTIAITERKPAVVNKEQDKPAPPIEYSGLITDEEGKGLYGASVKVKGTNIGTSTDANGFFKLDVLAVNAVLEISFVGFEKQAFPISYLKSVNNNHIILKRSDSPLDVVQVEAYRTNSRRISTGNISTIKAAVIEKQPVNNPLLALQGRVPGLFITQTTGIAGTGVVARIQGQNSILAGSDPLYVVDGVPIPSQLMPPTNSIMGSSSVGLPVLSQPGSGSPLTFINPSDIESIDVLKDADATAIYGSRAANGAILITTKKGKAGKTSVNLNFQNGWGKVGSKIDMINADEYMALRKEGLANDNINLNVFPYNLPLYQYSLMPDIFAYDPKRNIDWQEELIGGTANYQDIQASVSGGNEFTQVMLGTGYHKETTVFPGDFSDQRASFHVNVNHLSTNRKFRAQFSSNYMNDNNHLPTTDFTANSLQMPPNSPALYNADGTLNWAQVDIGGSMVSTWDNPVGRNGQNYTNKTNNLLANLTLSYEVLPGLSIKSSFGYNSILIDEFSAITLDGLRPENRPTGSRVAIYGNSGMKSWIIEPHASYQTKIGGGKLEALVGTAIQQMDNDRTYITGRGYSSDAVLKDKLSAASLQVNQSFVSNYKYNALFGRLNYNWQDKYILNLTARRDGSSRFGSDNQFHNFGSVGGAWVFSKENFIANALPFISFGKLRASYGTTGNDQINDYLFLDLYQAVSAPLTYGGTTGLAPTGLPNPALQWEETKKLQFGLDLGMFNDRILIAANYYRNRSSNQLLSQALPTLTGFPAINAVNFPALVQNTGWELSFNTTNIKKRDFNWTSSFNITIPKNKLVEFPDLAKSPWAPYLVLGEPLTITKVYDFIGVNPTTGLNEARGANGTPTSSPSFFTDRTVWVNTAPKYYGGFVNTISYKGFELDFTFQYTNQIGKNFFYGSFPGSYGNQPAWVLDHWRKPGDISPRQRAVSGMSSATLTAASIAGDSPAGYSDASYIRLKNASLSWQMPGSWMKKIKFQQCRLYVHGQNLLTFSDFQGLDPETRSINSLPPLRVITIGVQATL
jgi:TonB-linked SusC/RagA family outer membrane protein